MSQYHSLFLLVGLYLWPQCQIVGQNTRLNEQVWSPDTSVIQYSDSSDAYIWYENKHLGIIFRYSTQFFDPLSGYGESDQDTCEWILFSSARFALQFYYPRQFQIRILNLASNKPPERLEPDSAIQLGYKLQKQSSPDSSSTQFVSVVTIYLSSDSFPQIAEDEGFQRASEQRDRTSFVDDSSHKLVQKWIMPVDQPNQDAASLDGFYWKGLRCEILLNEYTSGPPYSVPHVKSFLTRNRSDGLSVVASYDDEPPYDAGENARRIIDENDFYRIVDSLKFLK